MAISPEGLMVCAGLLLLGALLGAPLIVALFASLPFGSTAFATLPALGGASPLIYTLFTLLLLASLAVRRAFLRDLGLIFARHWTAWVMLLLAGYALVGAILFPRLFAGDTTVFIPVKGVITELSLAPASGNITQTAYFILGMLGFFAVGAMLVQGRNLTALRRGFFAFATVHAALGMIDLAGKLAGAGDVLLPIRTANYALLTEVEQSGFWRIAGGYSEASAFGANSLVALAFTFTYWRSTQSARALALTAVLFTLLMLSTSTTAYLGCAVLAIIALAAIGRSACRGRLRAQDLLLAVLAGVGVATLLAIYLYDESLFQPFIELFQTMVLNKPLSASGQERTYWNTQSLQSFLDTGGLGVGMGSSRSSSWMISTLSQLGLIGTLMVCALLAAMIRGMDGLRPTGEDAGLFAFSAAVRAGALASLLAATLGGGSADPGTLFFIALATVLGCRGQVMERRRGRTAAGHDVGL